MNERVFRVVDRLDRPWVVRIGSDGTPVVLIRRGEVLTPMLLRWLLGVAAQTPTQRHTALPAPQAARQAERLVCDVAGGAACATLPRISLAQLRHRTRVVMIVRTDRGPLVIGDQLTAAATLAVAAGGPPVIGADELLAPPAAAPRPARPVAGPRLAGRQLVHAGRRQTYRWVAVAVLAVGSLWVADAFDDAAGDGRYGVAEDARMEAVTVVTHAPPQTWAHVTDT